MSTIQSEPDLVENYRQGGFLNTLEFGSRPALIVLTAPIFHGAAAITPEMAAIIGASAAELYAIAPAV